MILTTLSLLASYVCWKTADLHEKWSLLWWLGIVFSAANFVAAILNLE